MGYIENNIIEDETIIYKAKKAWIMLYIVLSFMIFCTFLFSRFYSFLNSVEYRWILEFFNLSIIAVIIFFYSYIIFRLILPFITFEFALTNRRFIGKRGFILRKTIEINLTQLESISVSQPIIGRLFRFGNITIVGTGGTKEEFKAILNPYELQKEFNNLASKSSK